ncbi:DUF4082 domain-containing protein [Nocardioides ganghwensis]|uniref:DUF4082 domain-containing protein n=1 Tax=Nocardioides ganghwensis TaxID=252230 RepID=A0A4Q2SDA1_9ACTN|nr:DUF4082 domain-containing protein [Nocardioides ganghwensis]MBD3947148.1 DUF4082 domain-containing protein [Nocardioides ganghwensis]RYC00656.1 DUF4082 domain-containing protein [Nocardioides ganghwensis]
MKSHPTGARSARPATLFSLLTALTAAVIALLPHVLATAAPVSERSAASSYGVWSDSTVPAVPSSDDSRSVTLGLVFSSATAGRLHAVQYYAAGANRVATTGDVWNGAGRRVASVRFPATANDGWKTAWLSSSVRIRAGEKYTVSYRAPRGRHAMETGVFANGGTLSAKDLTAHRGTFGYGTGRPTETSRGSHYFIDVLFAPSSKTSTPVPSPDPTTTSSPTPTPTPTTTSSPTPTPTPTTTSSPTPTPTPTTTSNPTPTPTEPAGTCVKPDATNTGTTGTLTADSRTTLSTPGEVIENKRFSERILIRANNITLRNVQVDGGIDIGDELSGITLDHVRAESAGVTSSDNVTIQYSHLKAHNGDALYVSGWDGVQTTNLTVKHNFIDRPTFTSSDAHWDGIQMRGVRNVDIYCNNFDVGAWQYEYNVLIYSEPAFGGNYNIAVDSNWLNGGNFAIMGGASVPDGYTITNNKLRGADFYFGLCYPGGGITAENIDQVIQAGNTLDGAPLEKVCKASDFG